MQGERVRCAVREIVPCKGKQKFVISAACVHHVVATGRFGRIENHDCHASTLCFSPSKAIAERFPNISKLAS